MSVERQILVTWVNLGFYWYRCRACLFVFNPGSSLNESLNEVVIEKASEFVGGKKMQQKACCLQLRAVVLKLCSP